MCGTVPPITFKGCDENYRNPEYTFLPNNKVLKDGKYFGDVISHDPTNKILYIRVMTQNKYMRGKRMKFFY